MTVLLTGAAGFIGFHTAQALLARGDVVIGLDSLNDYYDPALKQARLAQLQAHKNFSFVQADIAHAATLAALQPTLSAVDRIIHLAAQAGVRYSLENPQAYIDANVTGQLTMLELARACAGRIKHFVYASSSSVYGGNRKTPFSVHDPVEQPVSLYAASKHAGELMARTYAHLFRIPCTGLRFFTVYGPWGRPDMAYYLFTHAILAGQPIPVYNNGEMRRDFTYIDDIVQGVLAALDHVPKGVPEAAPSRLYNLGNAHPEKLTDFIGVLERTLGRRAVYDYQPMQPGEMPTTSADIAESSRDLGFHPRVSIAEGLPRFVDWFKRYHGV